MELCRLHFWNLFRLPGLWEGSLRMHFYWFGHHMINEVRSKTTTLQRRWDPSDSFASCPSEDCSSATVALRLSNPMNDPLSMSEPLLGKRHRRTIA